MYQCPAFSYMPGRACQKPQVARRRRPASKPICSVRTARPIHQRTLVSKAVYLIPSPLTTSQGKSNDGAHHTRPPHSWQRVEDISRPSFFSRAVLAAGGSARTGPVRVKGARTLPSAPPIPRRLVGTNVPSSLFSFHPWTSCWLLPESG